MNNLHNNYTYDELNYKSSSPIIKNWDPTNYITFLYASNSSSGYSEICILAFKHKLDALKFFYDFIENLIEFHSKKSSFVKLDEITKAIELITTTQNDTSVNLNLVNFELDDISLSTCNDGYWSESSKLILDHIIKEIDSYFDFYGEEHLINDINSTSEKPEYSIFMLKRVQEDCRNLLKIDNTLDPFFVNEFNRLCQYMNNFWSDDHI